MIRRIVTSLLSLILYISIILTTVLFVTSKKIDLNEITGAVISNYISDIDLKNKKIISDELKNKVSNYLTSDKANEKELNKEISEFTKENNIDIDETKIKDALKETKNYLSDNKPLRKIVNLTINYFHNATILNILYVLDLVLIACIIGFSKTIYKGIKKVGKTFCSSGILIFIIAYLGLKFINIPIIITYLKDTLNYLKIVSYYEIGIGIVCYTLGIILNFIFSKNND